MELTDDEHAVVQVLRDLGDERLATTGAVAKRLDRSSDEVQSILDALVAKGAVAEHNAGTWNFKGSDSDDIPGGRLLIAVGLPSVTVQAAVRRATPSTLVPNRHRCWTGHQCL